MNEYDDIINLPRFISKNRKHMSNYDRAAQFAPFAALTGYDSSIKESARLTDNITELNEDELLFLDLKIQEIKMNIKNNPKVKLKYFVYDNKKDGGKYIEKIITIKKIDDIERLIYSDNKETIPIESILDITTIE